MDATVGTLMGFLAFVAVLVYFVLPAIVSVVNRVKKEVARFWVPPDAAVWVFSIAVGIGAAHYVGYLMPYFMALVPEYELTLPPDHVLTALGVLLGLGASGDVDLKKLLGGYLPPVELPLRR
jgi:glucan phosphoethanolaminetransferase (alkaline phosphatase superfamily)